MVDEVSRPKAPPLFASETDEIDCTARSSACRKDPRQLQHSHTTRTVIVGAVEDLVVASESFVHAEMIQVGAEHDRFRHRIRPAQDTDHIPGDARLQRDALYESLVAGAVSITAGFQSELTKLRADV